MLFKKIKPTKSLAKELSEIEGYLRDFLNDTGGEWDWDDYTTGESYHHHQAKHIQDFCIMIESLFPPESEGRLCSDDGLAALRSIQSRLQHAIPETLPKTNWFSSFVCNVAGIILALLIGCWIVILPLVGIHYIYDLFVK